MLEVLSTFKSYMYLLHPRSTLLLHVLLLHVLKAGWQRGR